MVTTSIGKRAETKVANHLSGQGFKVICHNWRTKTCEIDLIATKNHTAYLVEVKFRHSSNQGEGWEYITPSKLKQMKYAAQVWSQIDGWKYDIILMVASVSLSTDGYKIDNLIELQE